MTIKNYIGIDNGVTGSIGIVGPSGPIFFPTPTVKGQDYTKTKKNITRLDSLTLYKELQNVENPFAVLERPMVNPARFTATMSAVRCLEATLTVLETLQIPYQFIDSKEWQKALLPAGVEGAELKKASLDIGKRLFPILAPYASSDFDGLLIAEYARRKNL